MDAALKDAAPGFEFDFSRAVGPVHGVFGRDEMPGVFEEVDEPWESVRREADEFIEAGEHVVTPMTSYTGGATGSKCGLASPWSGRSTTGQSPASPSTGAGRGPRSRRAFGVGDVAGERGGCLVDDEAFQRRDREALERSFDPLDPEVEWDASRLADVVPDIAGVFQGHDGVGTSGEDG